MSDEPVSFELDLQDLFSDRDREAMLLQFDLWDLEDVREFAQPILRQLEIGRMPCYEPWPAERVALFRRWVEGGMAE